MGLQYAHIILLVDREANFKYITKKFILAKVWQNVTLDYFKRFIKKQIHAVNVCVGLDRNDDQEAGLGQGREGLLFRLRDHRQGNVTGHQRIWKRLI